MRSHHFLTFALVLTACGEAPSHHRGSVQGRHQDPGTVDQAETTEPPAPTGFETKTRVLQDRTYAIDVHLDASTVLCSAADYGATFLKVLIPDVANFTLFDHRNSGVGAPCIAAGMCSEDFDADTILDGAESRDEAIEMRVVLSGLYFIDHDNQTCSVMLDEDLSTTIRGVPFTHQRSAGISERVYADCLGIVP